MSNITGTSLITAGMDVSSGIMNGVRNTLFLTDLANLNWRGVIFGILN